MQRTLLGPMPNIVASCLRRLWVACEADHEVSLPSLNSATAQDGPIEPWVWMGKSHVAFSVLALAWPMTSAAVPPLLVTASLPDLLARRPAHNISAPAKGSRLDHDAFHAS